MAPLLARGGPGAAEAVAVLAGLVGLEIAAARALPPMLWAVGGLRLLETGLCLAYWTRRGWGLADLGLAGPRALPGLAIGLAFSASFGALVGLVELSGRLLWGLSFLRAVTSPYRPGRNAIQFVVVGGLVAPLFEELVFRGILYGGLRKRLGAFAATAVVAVLFAAAHSVTSPVPWVQAIGALLFCAAYEISGSLWAPVVLHAAGNLALFLAPLWLW